MEYGAGRKRGNPDFAFNGNGGFKKSKQETESFPSGIGSKLKPCTKFFSTTGCQFGEGCHFLHFVPGGIKAVTQMLGNNPALPSGPRNQMGPPPPSFPDGSSPPAVKSRLCTKFNTAEGCRFGDKCRFAHGEWELGKPTAPQFEDPRGMGPPPGGRFGRQMMDQQPPPGPGHAAAANFGASATAKISVDGSLAGAIIGKGGVNTKNICRVTGAKLAIRDHESDPNLKNIEMEGTFDQIKNASGMVRELIVSIGSGGPGHGGPPPMRNPSMPFFGGGGGGHGGGGGGHGGGHGGGGGGHGGGHGGGGGGGSQSHFKTRLCENFTKGSCTFGDRCHFAHGAEELRKGGGGMGM